MEEAKTTLSRRTLLKTAAAAGATAGYAAWGGKAPALAQSRELSMIGWASPAIPELLKRFTADTGIAVKYDVFPAKWDDVMQKFTLWGQTGYAGVDVMFADDLIGGLWSLNGWADDLSALPAYTDHQADLVEGINVLNNAVNGVYRSFFMLDLEPFFYNSAIVPEPPKTWDELVGLGQGATDEAAGVWGWRPTNGEGHAFNTVLMMLNQAGADLTTLDDPATLQALTFMYDWVQTAKITPASTVSEDNTVVASLAAAGKAAMWWTYGDGYAVALGIEGSVLTPETLQYARYPMGPASDVGLIHGWGLMMPKAAANKDLAAELINWYAQPEVIRDSSVALSVPPPYKSLLTDEAVVAKLPILTASVGWEEILRGTKFREPIVTSPQVTQLWTMFDNLGKFIASGQKTPAEAQAWAVGEYQIINSGI